MADRFEDFKKWEKSLDTNKEDRKKNKLERGKELAAWSAKGVNSGTRLSSYNEKFRSNFDRIFRSKISEDSSEVLEGKTKMSLDKDTTSISER